MKARNSSNYVEHIVGADGQLRKYVRLEDHETHVAALTSAFETPKTLPAIITHMELKVIAQYMLDNNITSLPTAGFVTKFRFPAGVTINGLLFPNVYKIALQAGTVTVWFWVMDGNWQLVKVNEVPLSACTTLDLQSLKDLSLRSLSGTATTEVK